MYLQAVRYPLAILYRFLIAFAFGYLCTYLFTMSVTNWLKFYLPKAESVFLAALIAILFYLFFVLMSFSIKTLKKLSTISLLFLSILFLLYKGVN